MGIIKLSNAPREAMAKNKQISYDELLTRRAWVITVILTLVGAFLFLKPFLSIILLATLLAFLTYPIYKWFLKKFNNKAGRA